MFELLGTVVSSVLGGGATGLLGVLFQRFADYKNRQLDIQVEREKMGHEIELRKADAEIMAQEWAARTKVAEVEAADHESVADAGAFAASYKLEPIQFSAGVKPSRGQAWLLVLLDCFRGAIRPWLTVYLSIFATLVYIETRKISNAMTPDQAFDVLKLVIGTILYLWTTCTLWWFGTRNKAAPPKTSA